jgi:hypothetical protein
MQPRISFLRDTKQIGAVSELRVMAALAEAGYRILVPYGEQCRYDIAIERDGRFQRVQVKTGRVRRGVVLFNAYSSHYHRRGGSTRYYRGEIDAFAICDRESGAVYLVASGEIGTSGSLRVTATRNCQRKNARWAEGYRIAPRPEGMVGSASKTAPAEPS